MSITDNLKKQFSNPNGFMGKIAGFIMANKNKERLHWAAEVLKVDRADDILEIGCGPGVSVELIAPKLTTGHYTAIDRSDVMINMAANRNRNKFYSTRISFHRGTLDTVELPSHMYDKIFAFNVSLFWKDPIKELDYIRYYLAEQGSLYIFHQPPLTKDSGTTIKFAEKTTAILQQADYTATEVIYKKLNPVMAVCIIAKPNKK